MLGTVDKHSKVLIALHKIPVYIFAIFLTFVLVASLITRAEYCGYKYGDNPAWIRQDILNLSIFIAVMLSILLLFYWLGEKLTKFKREHVILSILFLSVLVQITFIILAPAKQFADQDTVNRIAMNVINGRYGDFRKGGYLYKFPNNVGITLFLSFLYRIYPVPLILPKIMNVLFSTTTSYLTYGIYEETVSSYNKGSKVNYAIVILSGFFLPMILLNNLAYNDVYATTLFAGAVINSIRYVKTKRKRNIILCVILLIIGDFLRQVGTIFVIAITLYFILKKIHVVKAIVFFGIVIILSRMPLYALNTYYLNTGKITEPIGKNAVPVYMWLNIGMNHNKIGYWDNSYSYSLYIYEGEYNKEKTSQIYKSLIKKNIEENGIDKIAKTYIKKNIWLWTEGTYQAEYYGVGSWGYSYATFVTEIFKNNRPLRDQIRWVLHGTNFLILFLTLVGLLHSIIKKSLYPLMLPAILVLGFIGFYTLWEIKPRYIYPIYPYLLIMACYGLSIIYRKLIRRDRA